MHPEPPALASTGVHGLDFVLRGGLPRGKTTVVEGGPGTGKTTLGLQFLLEGVRAGERVLFLTLAQGNEDLQLIARSHGWSLDGVDVREIAPLSPDGSQTVFHTADVELRETAGALRALVLEHRPDRVVLDSFDALRALAGEHVSRYREEVILLLGAVREVDATALLLGGAPAEREGFAVEALAHGMIELASGVAPYGAERRSLRVRKVRGLDFITGQHDYAIRTGGLEVFPRLQVPEGTSQPEPDIVSSGVEAIDTMLGGGLDSGTACLIVGAAGTGKSTLALSYAYAALDRGEGAAVFLLDERRQTFLARSEGVGFDVGPYLESGQFHLESVDPGDVSPGEFAQSVRQAIERGARVVVIDSLTGYFHAMGTEDLLIVQMHELLAYMGQLGVLCLLVSSHARALGDDDVLDVSYLSDTALLLRTFEAAGRVRVVVSVEKKRYGRHEMALRELRVTDAGLEVGEPLDRFESVLATKPTYLGPPERLLGGAGEDGR